MRICEGAYLLYVTETKRKSRRSIAKYIANKRPSVYLSKQKFSVKTEQLAHLFW